MDYMDLGVGVGMEVVVVGAGGGGCGVSCIVKSALSLPNHSNTVKRQPLNQYEILLIEILQNCRHYHDKEHNAHAPFTCWHLPTK